MSVAIAATVGALFALGTFLLLRRDLVNVVFGLAILTQAANVYLIAMGGIEAGTLDTGRTRHRPERQTGRRARQTPE